MVDYTGQNFGHYRLGPCLGEGSCGQTYLAYHAQRRTQAVVKILRVMVTEENARLFRQEAQRLTALTHPQLVRVLDFGVREGGLPYLVMDYLPGGSLRQRYPRGSRMPLPTAISYTKQAAAALQYLHAAGLLHGDVKPENMLLERDGSLRLADWGVTTLVERLHAQRPRSPLGTVLYMAPEQIQSQPGPASDQYSLAVVLYEWLCGAPPFEGTTIEVAARHCNAAPPPLRERLAGLPADIDLAILRALQKDPRARFPGVMAFATALEEAIVETFKATPAQFLPAVEPPPPLAASASLPAFSSPAAEATYQSGPAAGQPDTLSTDPVSYMAVRPDATTSASLVPSSEAGQGTAVLPPPPMPLNYFPLTRGQPTLLHLLSMIVYLMVSSAILAPSILLPQGAIATNIYIAIISILVLPLVLLLNGALFGLWRGPLIAVLYALITIVIALWPSGNTGGRSLTLWPPTPDALGLYVFALSWPLAALVVGLTYRRRLFRSFWRAFSSACLGMLILLIGLFIAVGMGFWATTWSSSSASPNEAIANAAAAMAVLLCLSPFYTGLIAALYGLLEMAVQTITARLLGRPPAWHQTA